VVGDNVSHRPSGDLICLRGNEGDASEGTRAKTRPSRRSSRHASHLTSGDCDKPFESHVVAQVRCSDLFVASLGFGKKVELHNVRRGCVLVGDEFSKC
jgi:hypothetical protein